MRMPLPLLLLLLLSWTVLPAASPHGRVKAACDGLNGCVGGGGGEARERAVRAFPRA